MENQENIHQISKEELKFIANETLCALGGGLCLSLFIGAERFSALPERGLSFFFRANNPNDYNFAKITVNHWDLYDLKLCKMVDGNIEKEDTTKDIYAEDLQKLFEEKSGLFLSFSKRIFS